MALRIKDIGETALIERLKRNIGYGNSVIKGIGDDAAVVKWTGNKYLLLTADMLIEGVHFTPRKATPYQIGWKALGRNISDIAAMGGVSRYALVCLAVNGRTPMRYIEEIYRGIRGLAKKFGVNIVGGDTSRSEMTMISVTVAGEVEKANLTLRSGAKKGDMIMVTGSIGGSIKGHHLDFIPRQKEARAIVKDYDVTSMIDVSDGLLLDLGRVLDASGVGARLYKAAVPVSTLADSFESAVSEGEDYELLFTMSNDQAQRLLKKGPIGAGRTSVSAIGEIIDIKGGYLLVDPMGREKKIKAKGYSHF